MSGSIDPPEYDEPGGRAHRGLARRAQVLYRVDRPAALPVE
jgi:hypothetical protein